jgi:predicted ATPase/DNA-binding SARP family transcriptional activator
MARLSLSLLGSFEVTLEGVPVSGFVSNKVRALLAYLAVESDRPHRRETLAGLLWPDWPDTSARSNLRNALANLRKVVGDREADPPYLLSSRETLQFNLASDHWLDVATFRAAVGGPSPNVERLQEALSLYRGCFLEGFAIADSTAYEDWCLLVREQLQGQCLTALEQMMAHCEGQGEIRRALDYSQRLLALAPWQESGHRQRMRLLALAGQRSAALVQYEACRDQLAQELGVEPAAETVQLYEEIREGRYPQRDKGTERAPEGEISPPQARPPHNLPLPATPFVGREAQLAEVHELLGRPELRLLTLTGAGGTGKTRLALQVASRLVDRYRDGICFVALAPIRDPALIVPTIAAALGVRAMGGMPLLEALKNALWDKEQLLVLDNFEQVVEAGPAVGELLASVSGLKVLVTSRAPLHVYGEHTYLVPPMELPYAQALFQGGLHPSLHRRGLSLEQLGQTEAVSLFVHCARRVRPGFALDERSAPAVAEICARLDGLPLAIELAAARVRLLAPQVLLAHLRERSAALRLLAGGPRDLADRQRALQATIEWSYDLLSPDERTLFGRLSVFAGGCTLAAVQAVALESLDPSASTALGLQTSALDLPESLVDQSLLQISDPRVPRFTMLETVREFAAERLEENGEAEVTRDRHAAYYAGALQRWAEDLKGRRQLEALDEVEADLDNARAAWEWALERDRADYLDRALEGFCLFYEWRGRYEEGRNACQRLVDKWAAHSDAGDWAVAGGLEESVPDLPSETRPGEAGTARTDSGEGDAARAHLGLADDGVKLRVMARALAWQSRLGRTLGQFELADRCFARALALLEEHRSSGQEAERAFILLSMAERARDTDLERARRLAGRSLALYRALGDPWGMAKAYAQLGGLGWPHDEYGKMRQWLLESLALSQVASDRRGILWALLGLGHSAANTGQLDDGERMAREALAAARDVGDGDLVRMAVVVLSTALYDSGRFAEALTVREEDLTICRDEGHLEGETRALAELGAAARHQGDYCKARDLVQEALSLCRASGERACVVRCCMELASLELAEGANDQAEDWLKQGLAISPGFGRHHLVGDLWSLLAYLACRRGRRARARGHLSAALRITAESRRRSSALQLLPAMALLLVDDGDTTRAVELFALALRHPYVANSRWFEDVAGREIAAASRALPPEVVSAAQECGRARELWAMVEQLRGGS